MQFCLSKLIKEADVSSRNTTRPALGHKTSGFTLTELLVVLAIMGLMVLLAMPALSALRTSEGVNSAVNGVSLLLGQARNYAMAHNTYVWVGFYESTSTQTLTVGMVGGTTSSVSDLANSNYVPIAQVQYFPHLNITTVASVEASNSSMTSSSSKTPWANGTELNASTLAGFTQTAGGTTITFPQGSILQFDPQGEVNVSSSGVLPHWIQFGLQPIQGGNTTNPNVAAVQIAGLSGAIQVFRP
jgi:prepilin-type N-terminal cleavage/methylation domain-containing protein